MVSARRTEAASDTLSKISSHCIGQAMRSLRREVAGTSDLTPVS